MKKRNEWCVADKGKYFVLTQKGKDEVASYRNKTVGEPVDEYGDEAVWHQVEAGHVEEIDIPDWIVKEGYRVVYEHKGHRLSAGNPVVFPEKELAERHLKNYQEYPWFHETLFIAPATYEGRALMERREYEGKKVFNKSWYYGISVLCAGDFVEQEIVDDLIDMLPPACMRSDCTQLGEPMKHQVDMDGKTKALYATFKKVADNTWEYCGACFRGNYSRKEIDA